MKNGLCDYGCDNTGIYILKNGKKCCSTSFNKCPEMKKKNSNGLVKAHQEGKMNCSFGGNNNWAKGKTAYSDPRIKSDYKPEEIFTNGFNNNELVKKILITEELVEYKCSICNIFEWNNDLLTLHMDHINGNSSDNRIDNLRLLCPNCHSQTETYCNRGYIKKTDKEYIDALLKHNLIIYRALKELKVVTGGTNWKRSKYIIEKYNLKASMA